MLVAMPDFVNGKIGSHNLLSESIVVAIGFQYIHGQTTESSKTERRPERFLGVTNMKSRSRILYPDNTSCTSHLG
jgi:hypothetical protein